MSTIDFKETKAFQFTKFHFKLYMRYGTANKMIKKTNETKQLQLLVGVKYIYNERKLTRQHADHLR